jgi:tetratricopeptide (TPR) repeat protein
MRDSASSDATASVAAVARKQLLLRIGRWSAALIAIALIGAGSCGVYRIWRDKHLEQQASAFAARGDVQSAVLVARHLLQIDAANLVATRLMTELAERSASIDAIEWRKRLVSLQPGNSENELALAATALRFGKIVLAANALNAVDAHWHDTSQYQQLAGAVALAEHQPEKAEQCFSRALEQEPSNHQIALNLASVQLASSNANSAEAARANLRRLIAEPDVHIAALRALTVDALAHANTEAARSWSAMLLEQSAPIFSDYLLHLEATRGGADPTAPLDKAKTAATGSAERVAELITWMNRHELAAEALAWSGSFERTLASTQPVPLAIAESLSCMRDWPALARFVEEANWGDHESVRLAVQSHAVRHVGDNQSSAEAAALWRAAIKAAQGRPEQLATIAKLAEGWGYRSEAADVLWQIATGATGAKQALATLQKYYSQTHDSHGLLRVAKRALELNPNDLVAANNCASLSLLLNVDTAARRLAEKLYIEHPTNAAFAATYAFALHTEGKTADALRVLERLKDQQLRQPAMAAYYVVMLAANGNVERAREFLPAAQRANLLPEEQTLLADAARKLNANS